MGKLIDFEAYPVRITLPILLQDKTTKKNIIWATDAYSEKGTGFQDTDHIERMAIRGIDSINLQSRTEKAMEEQQERTRKKAEVFTPVWLCNKMNNYADEQWFEQKGIFNFENEAEHTWTVNEDKIPFDEKRTWKAYVDSRRLEITCGEAPYLVSRYDATTGELILPPLRRIGMLDRKLRVVNENTQNSDEWLYWTLRAFQSCYGYEYQGDNLLIARINLIMTFADYFRERMERDYTAGILQPDDPLLYDKLKILRRTNCCARIEEVSWWRSEMPTKLEMMHGMNILKANGMKADFIFSHDGPSSSLEILGGGLLSPDPLNQYLEKVKQKTTYNKWFFGHHHVDRQITEKDTVIYEQITRIF